ncbi:hypothetical protein C8J57DRAFT_1278148 [Mycena rebaudengoi]|nr:hypothetical protein C8J57DRAFT_1278148 [Mycena rebaudengoi]
MDLEQAAGIFLGNWIGKINLTLVALIAFYVQAFFCHRLWGISRNIYLLLCTITLLAFALSAAFVATGFAFADPFTSDTRIWIGVHLGSVLAGDLILCGSTIYFLLRQSKRSLPHTASLLNNIVRLTFQSAAPAVLVALVNLVCSQLGAVSASNGWIMGAIIANTALPKIYAISAMWTLNSRKRILLQYLSGERNSSMERLSGRRPTEIELGGLSGSRIPAFQIRTQVETLVHHDKYPQEKSPGADYVGESEPIKTVSARGTRSNEKEALPMDAP